MNFLESLDGRDLLVMFVAGTVAGFAFYWLDMLALSKVETAVGIPAGTL
jgi:hypothetical protein